MYRSTIAILIAASIGYVAHAQTRNVNDMMDEMKVKYGQTFDQCQELATSRGYRLSNQDESETRAVMMFIEGCIMGKQH